MKDQNIKHIVFSVAGPKVNQSISMTNRDFEIDEKIILKKFGLDSCHILNDWESIGHGLSLFDTKEMSFINKCDGFNQTSLVIGPGTGLGAAQVIEELIEMAKKFREDLERGIALGLSSAERAFYDALAVRSA